MKNKQLILNKKINIRKYSLIKYLLKEFWNIYLTNLINVYSFVRYSIIFY